MSKIYQKPVLAIEERNCEIILLYQHFIEMLIKFQTTPGADSEHAGGQEGHGPALDRSGKFAPAGEGLHLYIQSKSFEIGFM